MHAGAQPAQPDPGRIAAVDALRGLVVLVLVPHVYGAFGLHEMARLHPDSGPWAALANQATHVPWEGAALWDLVMPLFVFVVGVAMALSVDRRRAAGATTWSLLAHAALRSLMLIVLGLLLVAPRRTLFDALMPYALLATGLPWSRWFGGGSARRAAWLDLGLPALVLGAVVAWMVTHVERLGGYDFNQILSQLGLAYLPALLLMGRGLRTPLVHALLVLAGWAVAFMLHPSQGAPWAQGDNPAAAFDVWLFALLPRAEPYVINEHGYHTLLFVPLVATMLLGVACGRLLRQRAGALRSLVVPLAAAGAAAWVAGAWLLTAIGIPLVKSIWTPSWAVFSGGVCLMALAAVLAGTRQALAGPVLRALAVLGSNALLLYVIAYLDRWRITGAAARLFGEALTGSALAPLLNSLLVLAVLWAFAWLLDRSRIHVRF